MILNNFKHIIAYRVLGANASNYINSLVDFTGKNVTAQSGHSVYDALCNDLRTMMNTHGKRNLKWSDKSYDAYSTGGVTIGATYGVLFGSGTTPVNENDHNMSGEVVTTYNSTQTYEETKDSITFTYSLTNTGTAEIVIGEVGLFRTTCQRNNSSSNKYYYSDVLMERTVLGVPITIAPGATAQVTYTIRMNYLE